MSEDKTKREMKKILGEDPVFINLGLTIFSEALIEQGAHVINVNWRPPRKTPSDIEDILKKVL